MSAYECYNAHECFIDVANPVSPLLCRAFVRQGTLLLTRAPLGSLHVRPGFMLFI